MSEIEIVNIVLKLAMTFATAALCLYFTVRGYRRRETPGIWGAATATCALSVLGLLQVIRWGAYAMHDQVLLERAFEGSWAELEALMSVAFLIGMGQFYYFYRKSKLVAADQQKGGEPNGNGTEGRSIQARPRWRL